MQTFNTNVLNNLPSIFNKIPKSVTDLNLSSNNLCVSDYIKNEQLQATFSAIPETVTHLSLINNGFYSKTPEDIAAILKSIPASVTQISFDYDELNLLYEPRSEK